MNLNIQKPIYLMGGGHGRGMRSTFCILRSIIKDIGKVKPTISYVGVANGDNMVAYLMISIMMKAARKCHVKRVLIASKKADIGKAREALQSADAIFMSGGDVDAGMKILEEKNMVSFFRDLSKQDKLFFGVSAGSIMLANEWVRWRDPHDDSTTELFPCLSIVPVICDTHAEAEDWEELKAVLQLKEDGAFGYGIPSGSCLKIYPDGRAEALGGVITRYIRQSGQVERQANLLPIDHTK
ncbi:MAG TPA: Type 1 glutamine amidotransferase-like domain-containing protein [Dehalococcoidia bacterium]|nr:Type 1 glutamine amidotransferase-like domain-containing protein [Dehalococcoidia bacterium]